jgi:Uma2 family endonuclease
MIELADAEACVMEQRSGLLSVAARWSAIMSTVPPRPRTREIEYPSGDGKSTAETELHLLDMIDTIQVLADYYAEEPKVYVCGNLLLYYEEGNPRKHVSPDVLVALDVPKQPLRDTYLVWREGKAPDFIVEITSKSTKHEDKKKEFGIYREILRVSEYFLFDPTEDYLKPPLQGFRLIGGQYVGIEPVAGRLPSQVLGLYLERDGKQLRLFDPATGRRLPTRLEAREQAERRSDEESRRADQESRRADEESRRAESAELAQNHLVEEIDRLRREIEALRKPQRLNE